MKFRGPLHTLVYRAELCTGCEMCTHVCPHRVFIMNGRKAEIALGEACMECGACRMNCPSQAITVDSGVGCAYALMRAALTGREESCA